MLRRRKMVRGYTDEPVECESVERIVERARKAPSAGFSQGLRFVVVTELEGRRAVARAGGEEWYAERGMGGWLSQAPVQVVVCVLEEDYHERYRRAVTPVAAVTIGHPGAETVAGSRSKFPWKPLGEVARWEHW